MPERLKTFLHKQWPWLFIVTILLGIAGGFLFMVLEFQDHLWRISPTAMGLDVTYSNDGILCDVDVMMVTTSGARYHGYIDRLGGYTRESIPYTCLESINGAPPFNPRATRIKYLDLTWHFDGDTRLYRHRKWLH